MCSGLGLVEGVGGATSQLGFLNVSWGSASCPLAEGVVVSGAVCTQPSPPLLARNHRLLELKGLNP